MSTAYESLEPNYAEIVVTEIGRGKAHRITTGYPKTQKAITSGESAETIATTLRAEHLRRYPDDPEAADRFIREVLTTLQTTVIINY